jgi:hypothetical protein
VLDQRCDAAFALSPYSSSPVPAERTRGRESVATERRDEIGGWGEPRVPFKHAMQIAAGSELDEQLGDARAGMVTGSAPLNLPRSYARIGVLAAGAEVTEV